MERVAPQMQAGSTGQSYASWLAHPSGTELAEMNELSKLNDRAGRMAGAHRKIVDLQKENRTLKGTIAALQQRLRTETDAVAQAHVLGLDLREANQNLVLATFDAEDAQLAAEAQSHRQIVFLAMLAHELRNPMASISVAGNVIESLKIDHVRLNKLLAIVRRQIDHLLRLVDDLLDVARISTGKISLQTSSILLSAVIDDALETASGFLIKRGQTTAVTLPALPVYLDADLVRLSQLFSNLLINASKFSPPFATIYVSASVDQDRLVVQVKDDGQGIEPEFQASIFDLFAQGANAHEHSLEGGLGVGLALVRKLAQLHGGAVRVESAGAGCGSAFIVTLPIGEKA